MSTNQDEPSVSSSGMLPRAMSMWFFMRARWAWLCSGHALLAFPFMVYEMAWHTSLGWGSIAFLSAIFWPLIKPRPFEHIPGAG